MSAPTTVICTYRVSPGREAEFSKLLSRHSPALRSIDLVTNDPPQHFWGTEEDDAPFFVEIFKWKDEESSSLAHEHPEVMAIWEPMDKLTENRNGRPNMEFTNVQPFTPLG